MGLPTELVLGLGASEPIVSPGPQAPSPCVRQPRAGPGLVWDLGRWPPAIALPLPCSSFSPTCKGGRQHLLCEPQAGVVRIRMLCNEVCVQGGLWFLCLMAASSSSPRYLWKPTVS